MSKINIKQIIQDQKKKIFVKPIVVNNPSFELQQINDLWNLFNLYADHRRQADIRQIVSTAKTLGFDRTHEFIYKGLVDVSNSLQGRWIGFQQFLDLLTNMIGNPLNQQGRRQAFNLVDRQGQDRLTFDNLKKLAQQLKYNLTDDQIQQAIQSIAGKGKQQITWQQFNSVLTKKMQKKLKN